jgi:hypothetical protein
MAAQAWKIYAEAKRKIGTGTMALGAGVFRMSLHKSSASGKITSLSTISIFSSVGFEIPAAGGYPAGGKQLLPATGRWTIGPDILTMKFTYTAAGLVFTANGADLVGIRYALIHKSAGAVTSGPVLCYCSLSNQAFTINNGNQLTILPATTGVFTLS